MGSALCAAACGDKSTFVQYETIDQNTAALARVRFDFRATDQACGSRIYRVDSQIAHLLFDYNAQPDGRRTNATASQLHSRKYLLAVYRGCSSVKFDDGETLRFRSRPCLGNSHLVAFPQTKCRRSVGRNISVTLLKTLVLTLIVQIITTDNHSSCHFCGNNHTAKDASANRHISSERAFLVYVRALNSFLRCLDPKADIAVPATTVPANLSHKGDSTLFQKRFFVKKVGHCCTPSMTSIVLFTV
jgi:hypothetical protein